MAWNNTSHQTPGMRRATAGETATVASITRPQRRWKPGPSTARSVCTTRIEAGRRGSAASTAGTALTTPYQRTASARAKRGRSSQRRRTKAMSPERPKRAASSARIVTSPASGWLSSAQTATSIPAASPASTSSIAVSPPPRTTCGKTAQSRRGVVMASRPILSPAPVR